jgi:hypothetical protein
MDQGADRLGFAGATRRARGRRLAFVAAVTCYLLAPLAVLAPRGPAPVDPWWDYCMGLGVAATGALALMPLLSARWWAPQYRSMELSRLVQHLHRRLSYLLLALLFAHVVGLAVLEPRVLDYLLLTAPAYMLAGLGALILICTLILTARYRSRLAWGHPGWRRWHAGLSAVAIGLTGWHLWGAAYYFATPGALVAGGWLLCVPLACSLVWHRWPPARGASPRPFADSGTWGILALLACASLAGAGWLAWSPTAPADDPARPYPCSRCL